MGPKSGAYIERTAMSTAEREIKESPIRQSAKEVISYRLTTTPWGTGAANPVVRLYRYNPVNQSLTDVSGTNLTGTASMSGEVLITPAVTGLVEGERYYLECQFVVSGNTLVAYAKIVGEE